MWDPKHRREIAQLLRWLADETEVGRADGELDITFHVEPVPKPRSWFDDPKKPIEYDARADGSTWSMRVHALRVPPRD